MFEINPPPTMQTVLARPPCQKCGTPMWLARIEPYSEDHDQRTFECPRCDHSETMVVRYRGRLRA